MWSAIYNTRSHVSLLFLLIQRLKFLLYSCKYRVITKISLTIIIVNLSISAVDAFRTSFRPFPSMLNEWFFDKLIDYHEGIIYCMRCICCVSVDARIRGEAQIYWTFKHHSCMSDLRLLE